MKRKLNWLLLNGPLVAFVYCGYFLDIEGAKKVAVFAAWVLFITSFAYFTDSAKAVIQKNGRCFPAFVDILMDLSLSIVFVWFGDILAGSFYLAHMVIQQGMIASALENKES